MALVVGDERVMAAHDAAVKSAMAQVEERYVATRREVNGGNEARLRKDGRRPV